MNRTTRTISKINLGLIILLALAEFSCDKVDDYSKNIQTYRTEKDIWLSNDFESPFLKTNTPFNRLTYFEINKNFKIEADILKNPEDDSLRLVTNLGETRTYFIYGLAQFKIDNEGHSLVLLDDGNNNLFVPFADETSGESTYGGGRYIETKIPSGNTITLDFNMAFNPYCAYVDGYSCPLPPKSNVIKVAIEAGEKNYTP
ncbi:MAG: DUF1684 domain-containing protein [Bacteroidota bacterium]